MNFNFLKIKNKEILIFLVFYITIILGFFFNEDSLGGAQHDFLHHYKISEMFNVDFKETFKNFGNPNYENMHTRNSPIFWIVFSFFSKIFSIDIIRLLNSLVSILIGVFFFKCLLLRFNNISRVVLLILSSAIFLSPTIRSLSIWPYSLIWGLFFFIVSIYFFLKQKLNNNLNTNLILSFKQLFFLILSSYFYPSFGIFFLYFGYNLYLKFKVSKNLFYLIFFCFLLSIPFFYYVFSKNIINAFYGAEGIGVSLSQSLNLSNKIMIILTIFLYFIIPFINIKKVIHDLNKINYQNIILIIIFTILNIYFFNFPYIESGSYGGGFFHKLSNIIFKNNIFFFLSFAISLIFLVLIFKKNFNNFLLVILLILYNPQFTIYNKYFDPLIFVLFFTLFELDFDKHYFKKKYKHAQLYFFLISYLSIALYKSYLFSI